MSRHMKTGMHGVKGLRDSMEIRSYRHLLMFPQVRWHTSSDSTNRLKCISLISELIALIDVGAEQFDLKLMSSICYWLIPLYRLAQSSVCCKFNIDLNTVWANLMYCFTFDIIYMATLCQFISQVHNKILSIPPWVKRIATFWMKIHWISRCPCINSILALYFTKQSTGH